MLRRWRGGVAGVAAFLAIAGGSSAAGASEEPQRTSGADPVATAEDAPDANPAATFVPMPDLGLAHRRSDGGINLLRTPLSDVEPDVGEVYRVRSLPASTGFRSDRSKVVAGDLADVTAGDDGTADHVILVMGSDGGVRVWGIGGGSDTTPRLWQVLRRSAGWSWADARPVVGDLNRDGWDDLVVVHRARGGGNVWLMLSDGEQLGAPERWGRVDGDVATGRYSLADLDGDGNEDLVVSDTDDPVWDMHYFTNFLATRADGTGFADTYYVDVHHRMDGWSFANSRQLAGDVDGDGLADLVTVHRSGSGGLIVWVAVNCSTPPGNFCFEAPVRWQTLASGWSFANSRQYLADTDGDHVEDLVSVHRSGTGGMWLWRHVSDGAAFLAPEQGTGLAASAGWSFASSRESVADTWGDVGP